MFVKALWFKEYKQVQGLLWGIFAAVFFLLPIQVMQQLDKTEKLVTQGVTVQYITLTQVLPIFLPFLLITLGCLQIGGERSHNQDNFTFSLPYARSTIYLTKWGLGALAILISLTVNFVITYFLIEASPLRAYLKVYPSIGPFWLHLLLASLAIYTLTLFLGALSGGPAFQAAFSLIFSFFPLGVTVLVLELLAVHDVVFHWQIGVAGTSLWDLMMDLSLVTHFMPISGWHRLLSPVWRMVVIDFSYVAAFLVWGACLYSKNRLEYNGRMLVFPSMHTFFTVGITACFAMLGGGFISTAGSRTGDLSDIITYYIGALVAGGLAYIATMKLLKQPVKFWLKKVDSR